MAEEHRGEQHRVTRSVVVEAGTDEVWEAVADPDRRAAWLDDPDAAARTVRVDRAEVGERLVWTWWRSEGSVGSEGSGGDEPDASTVEIALRPLEGGGTRVVVTETPLVGGPRASASVSAASPAGRGALAGPGPLSARWELRLLGLELLFVAARARVLF